MGQLIAKIYVQVTGSRASLNGSMLDIRPGFCNADPITKYGKRIQLIQVMTIPLVPVISLVCLLAISLYSGSNDILLLKQQNSRLYSAERIGQVIHDLQVERGAVLLYNGCQCEISTHRLAPTFEATHHSFQNIELISTKYWSTDMKWSTPTELHDEIERRREVYTSNFTVDKREIIAFYDLALREVEIVLHIIVRGSKKTIIWEQMLAFLLLHDSSEKYSSSYSDVLVEVMKAEHAGTNVTFGEARLKYLEREKLAQESLRLAKQYSKICIMLYNKYFNSDNVLVVKLRVIRICILQDNCAQDTTLNDRPTAIVSATWIRTCLELSDQMNFIAKQLADLVKIEIEKLKDKDSSWLIVNCICSLCVMIISPVIIYLLYNITKFIQNFAVGLSEKTKKLRKEKKKSDNLLYQMLPKSVALQLKLSKKVSAENFNRVTLFFSDVVGFTSISAKCTPMQVVDFLNALYHMFDTTIGRYDVYKVETIGDAYMIVSGLPQRNGKRHAGEIAGVALHLLKDIMKFRIPHIPDERITLRIGIHTGGVVAGVVGTKMPRFCLFGETVNIASCMESHGKPMKIQITEDCRNALVDLGGYTIELRGKIQGIGEMTTYFMTGKEEKVNRPVVKVE